jgi:hypothetical protein
LTPNHAQYINSAILDVGIRNIAIERVPNLGRKFSMINIHSRRSILLAIVALPLLTAAPALADPCQIPPASGTATWGPILIKRALDRFKLKSVPAARTQ